MNFLKNLSSEKFRWVALVFLSLGLAIVIIDNTVLNVAIPYILRDLHTSFDSMQWVISGYALIIATLLITVGRLGDMFGRKKIFILGTICFAIGSFIASISQNIAILFLGEAFIEAIGASMMMTSSLSLLASEFQGKERSIAFGIWGSVAGAAATFGPLMGGFLTTYYSWRWSLRINVVVALFAVLGSVFIQESTGNGQKKLDYLGTLFSALGLFALIFGFIEGQRFGWWTPNQQFSFLGIAWPFSNISVIPFAFALSLEFLLWFVITELFLEKKGENPLLRLSLFKNLGFSFSLTTLIIVSLGQFGVFFIMPIFLQNVLNLTAFQTGLIFLFSSISIVIFGPLSGIIASKIGPKWLATVGMAFLAIGAYLLMTSLNSNASGFSLAPGLIVLGIGVGMASAQLTNLTLSNAPVEFAGEASASNTTARQVGTSIGIAIIGMVLSNSLTTNISKNIQADSQIPTLAKNAIIKSLKNISVESGQHTTSKVTQFPAIVHAVNSDVTNAIVIGSKNALEYAVFFIAAGALFSLLIPNIKPEKEKNKNEDVEHDKERTHGEFTLQ